MVRWTWASQLPPPPHWPWTGDRAVGRHGSGTLGICRRRGISPLPNPCLHALSSLPGLSHPTFTPRPLGNQLGSLFCPVRVTSLCYNKTPTMQPALLQPAFSWALDSSPAALQRQHPTPPHPHTPTPRAPANAGAKPSTSHPHVPFCSARAPGMTNEGLNQEQSPGAPGG